MVKVSEELPRNADGTAHLDKWAQRVSDAHEHLDSGFLAYVAQGLAEAAPDLLDSGLELAEVVAELNMDQAAVRADPGGMDKGGGAAAAAIHLVALARRFGAGAA